MTPCRTNPCHLRRTYNATLWWLVVFSMWGHVHQHVVVHAQFAANPLPLLNASAALVLNGVASFDSSGVSVSGVGDMNGDGMDDFVIGADFVATTGNQAGQVYLLFGRGAATPWEPNPFELSTLNGTNGVKLNGFVESARLGFSAAGVQDVNGDGINDVLIGTQSGDAAFVVFGVNGTWPATVTLEQGAFNGFTIVGEADDDTGYSVASAGDVNNDGVADIAIGARSADTPGGGSNSGRMDVLYGRSGGSSWPAVVNLATYVNASTGFSVHGGNGGDNCGEAVSGVGDVNGDGVDDVAMNCPGGDPPGASQGGIVVVVFGSAVAVPNTVTPSQLNGTNGFVVNAQRANDKIGSSLAPVGDVNADALDDFAIGAPLANGVGVDSGELYVLFGRNASTVPWPAQVDVSSLDGSTGFTLVGGDGGDELGSSVSPANDVNGDGIDDLLVGARKGGDNSRGQAFLLYGRAVWSATLTSDALNSATSNAFEGGGTDDACGESVSFVGDVNGDGRGDLAIGCSGASPGDTFVAGQTSVVFGPLFTSAPTTATPTTAPTTASPTTPAPTTVAPTTVAPTTVAPSTVAPTTVAPTTVAPTNTPTAPPTTAAPSTSSPSTTSPTTDSASSSGSPTTSTTTSPTTSPTPGTCETDGGFVPPGASCVNGVLVTATNTTVPPGVTSTLTSSITITGGASFEQPGGSTLVFVASGDQGTTSITVQGGGCATLGGDAVVSFVTDPSNGGVISNTGSLVLVVADCVIGAFGSVGATSAFEDSDCVAIGEGVQQASGNSISVGFAVTNSCGSKSSGLSTGAFAGIIVACCVVSAVIVIVGVKLAYNARNRRAHGALRMSLRKSNA